jgi:hypothetical protein
MEKAAILIKLEQGGYVVTQHDPLRSVVKLLFAGSLAECLAFLQKWMEDIGEIANQAVTVDAPAEAEITSLIRKAYGVG